MENIFIFFPPLKWTFDVCDINSKYFNQNIVRIVLLDLTANFIKSKTILTIVLPTQAEWVWKNYLFQTVRI